jgi:Flp pilus assembly CpaE family ATPase
VKRTIHLRQSVEGALRNWTRKEWEDVARERDGLSENLYVANLAAVQAAKERDVLKAALEEIMIEVGTSTLAHKIARAALERMGARKGEG